MPTSISRGSTGCPIRAALIVQRQSRDQKRLDVLRVDARTGASTLLFSDTSDTVDQPLATI